MFDTKFHADGSVTAFDCVLGYWVKLRSLDEFTPRLSATLSREERTAIREHMTRHACLTVFDTLKRGH